MASTAKLRKPMYYAHRLSEPQIEAWYQYIDRLMANYGRPKPTPEPVRLFRKAFEDQENRK
jgi:hypothetical protein